MALAALGIALWRFFRRHELTVPGLAVAVLLNVALYIHGNYPQDILHP